MKVLGIESSCDETAVAVVQDGKKILSNMIASQIDLHKVYGGVVPELAGRRHVDVMIPTVKQALSEAGINLEEIDLIAVAKGPGLIGALMLGITTAKALSLALEKPYIGINHVEAHLYASLMSHDEPVEFPCLGVVLSGGHTIISLIEGVGEYTILSETVDDAIGEAFDKAAKILGLPYPGGPEIEKLAKQGDPSRFSFKPGFVKRAKQHFSFSGLKTAVLYAYQGLPEVTQQDKADIAASFQKTAFQDVIKKTLNASKRFGCRTVLFGGGVTNSQTLRREFSSKADGLQLCWPSAGLSLDNGAMIAGLAYYQYSRDASPSPINLEGQARIPLSTPSLP